jgi:hypothetical protein
MSRKYAIHLKSGQRCDISFDADTVKAADVHDLIENTDGEIGEGLWVNKDDVSAIEIVKS